MEWILENYENTSTLKEKIASILVLELRDKLTEGGLTGGHHEVTKLAKSVIEKYANSSAVKDEIASIVVSKLKDKLTVHGVNGGDRKDA